MPNKQIISYCSGIGAGYSGTSKAPEYIKNLLVREDISNLSWQKKISPSRESLELKEIAAMPELCNMLTDLAANVKNIVDKKYFPVILGGDHSCAIGTWSGVSAAINKPIGLIWVDAHMDSHTIETSPSKRLHGMPLASLLGYGEKRFSHIEGTKPKILPENLCLIGIRSYEPEEEAFLKSLNVKIFYMEDVKRLGLKEVYQRAIEHVTRYTDNFGISIDIDAIDPIEAPGVGSPEKDGISAKEFMQNLPLIANHQKLIAAEIVEFNPELDKNDKTSLITINTLKQFLS